MPRRLTGLLAALALVVTGCTTYGPPELTVFADGRAIELAPVQYCDIQVTDCDANPGARARMTLRPGQPVQISVPTDVAESPWVVYVQSADAKGRPQPVKEQYFGPDEAFAYTARPEPGQRLLTVEVQQAAGRFDEDGQLLTRGIWAVRLRDR